MADGTRLRTMEESLRKTETQLLEIQKFVATSKEFMEETRARQDEHKKLIEEQFSQMTEHKKLIEEQGKKSDQQFSQMTEMLRMLLQKDQSLTASNLRNDSIQELLDRGILGASSNLPEQGTVGTPPRSSSMASNRDLEDNADISIQAASSYKGDFLKNLDSLSSTPRRSDLEANLDSSSAPTSFSSVISEVIHSSLEPMVFEIDSDEKNDWIDASTDLMEFGEADLSMNFSEFLVKVPAHKVFDIMSRRRKFTLVLGDKILALFASGLTLISSAVEATIKAEIVDHDKPWDPGGDSC